MDVIDQKKKSLISKILSTLSPPEKKQNKPNVSYENFHIKSIIKLLLFILYNYRK